MIDLIKAGGPLMILIILLSLSGLTVILERGWYFYKNEKHDGELLIAHLERFIKKNDKNTALKVCEEFRNTSAKVMKVILLQYDNSDLKEENYTLLEEKARECALRELPKLERHMWILGIMA